MRLQTRADQIRCTVAGLTLCALAIDRQLQWVSPGGLSCGVAWTMASTLSAGMEGLRPRPSCTFPNVASPSAVNRLRQARTVIDDTPTRWAIWVLATPSTANSRAWAHIT